MSWFLVDRRLQCEPDDVIEGELMTLLAYIDRLRNSRAVFAKLYASRVRECVARLEEMGVRVEWED